MLVKFIVVNLWCEIWPTIKNVKVITLRYIFVKTSRVEDLHQDRAH